MDKLNGFDEKLFPETPKPRLFNPDSAYEEIQYTPNWGVARPNRKQQRSPASPHNHSSSLKNSKTLTKNSSHSRKKWINFDIFPHKALSSFLIFLLLY